jgi:Carbon-nitrogen hydrolase
MDPVKVAAVQAAPVLLDRDETIAKVVTLAGKAAAEGARLVAFPEAFVPGYPDWVWRTPPWDADATALYARLSTRRSWSVPRPPTCSPRQQFDPVGHYSRPDIFRLCVDTSPRPAVTEPDSLRSPQ